MTAKIVLQVLPAGCGIPRREEIGRTSKMDAGRSVPCRYVTETPAQHNGKRTPRGTDRRGQLRIHALNEQRNQLAWRDRQRNRIRMTRASDDRLRECTNTKANGAQKGNTSHAKLRTLPWVLRARPARS